MVVTLLTRTQRVLNGRLERADNNIRRKKKSLTKKTDNLTCSHTRQAIAMLVNCDYNFMRCIFIFFLDKLFQKYQEMFSFYEDVQLLQVKTCQFLMERNYFFARLAKCEAAPCN